MLTLRPLGDKLVVDLLPDTDQTTASGLVVASGGYVRLDEDDKLDQMLERFERKGWTPTELADLRARYRDAEGKELWENRRQQVYVWARVVSIGPECRHAQVDQYVLVNRLHGQEVEGWLILPESAILAQR